MMKIFIFLILLPCFSWGQSTRLRNLFNDKTKIQNPFELRDPFKAPLIKSQDIESKEQVSLVRDGVYTNIPAVGEIDVKKLKIVGVLVGKERRAMARMGEGTDLIILKEGMKIGIDQAELKAILPGGIILVEKLLNVYGEEEYLETVIPISK